MLATKRPKSAAAWTMDIRVGASVGHGELAGASMLLRKVLVGELLAVNGLATGPLQNGRGR